MYYAFELPNVKRVHLVYELFSTYKIYFMHEIWSLILRSGITMANVLDRGRTFMAIKVKNVLFS